MKKKLKKNRIPKRIYRMKKIQVLKKIAQISKEKMNKNLFWKIRKKTL